MKTKQLLFILAFTLLIFSCKKDDDYRDAFEGVYSTDITGSMNFPDLLFFFPYEGSTAVSVNKLSSRELTIIIGGDIWTATVDKDGNLTIPSESDTFTDIDQETGDKISMNLTVTYTGYITGKKLYIKESFSGTATYTPYGGKTQNSAIGGSRAYNGTKK